VKEAAARERIHAHQRRRFPPHFEAMDRAEQELIRTGGKPLQRRQRIFALPQTMPGNRRGRAAIFRCDETVD
jgi:hypothetical protein